MDLKSIFIFVQLTMNSIVIGLAMEYLIQVSLCLSFKPIVRNANPTLLFLLYFLALNLFDFVKISICPFKISFVISDNSCLLLNSYVPEKVKPLKVISFLLLFVSEHL